MMQLMENIVYARKLYPQELGYREGIPREAGRYFYVSKKIAQEILFFPPLSSNILNDSILLNIIPPHTNKIVLSRYVFHNSKVVLDQRTGRDEYRLYLNKVLDPNSTFFKPGDIVLIDRKRSKTDLLYKIHQYPISQKSAEYNEIEKIMERKKISGSRRHALIPYDLLPFIEREYSVEEKLIPEEVVEEELEKEVNIQPTLQALPEEVLEEEFKFSKLIKENTFRDLLLFFYEYKCSITGKVIKYKDLLNLEAAHIIPDQYGGPRHPKNGLPLLRDLHWAFDYGFFTIEDDYTVTVHEDVIDSSILSEIEGTKLSLPSDERAWPSEISLKWHRSNVFGNFKSK